MQPNSPRQHHDVIVAWARGATIQKFHREGTSWVDDAEPTFDPLELYRVRAGPLLYRIYKCRGLEWEMPHLGLARSYEEERAAERDIYFISWVTPWMEVDQKVD